MVGLGGLVVGLVLALLGGYFLGSRQRVQRVKVNPKSTAESSDFTTERSDSKGPAPRKKRSPKVKPQHVEPLIEVAAEQRRIGGNGSPTSLSRRSSNESLNRKQPRERRDGPRRLVLCNWTLPVSIKKNDDTGEFDITWKDARDVITNMRCLKEDMEVHWIGYAGYDVPPEDQDALEEALEEFNCTPLFLQKELVDKFYSGYCKGVLWPLFHYLMPTNDQTFSKTYTALWQAYSAVNMIMAKKAHLLSEGDAKVWVWVHNYHLMLVPMFLRKQNPNVSCGFFCHVTWPTSAVFRTLPSRTNILRGMLSADLIGFHTYDYARHFRSSIKRLLDLDFHTRSGGVIGIKYNGREITLRISHVSVRSQELNSIAISRTCKDAAQRIKEQHPGRQIIIGVDDLDITKGTMLKMQAYNKFLETNPQWKNKVTFIYILTQGSNKCSAQRYEMKRHVEEEIAEIRKNFGDKVIHMIEQKPSIQDLCSIYVAADIALFSSFWDGFAMAPYEFTVAQGKLESPGSLIVSEFMGCSRSLSGVIRVNPWQLDEVAKAIEALLSSSPQARAANHKKRYNYVMSYTFKAWAEGFLKDLEVSAEANQSKQMMHLGWGSKVNLIFLPTDFTNLADFNPNKVMMSAFKRAKFRIVMFDYGGTLTEGAIGGGNIINSDKDRVSKLTLKHLSTIGRDQCNTVFIVTGQKRRVLERHFGRVKRIGLAAEKGAFYKWPDMEEWETVELGNLGWKHIVIKVMDEYTSRTAGSYVTEKEASLVWHFETADIEFGSIQASEMERYLARILNIFELEITRYDHSRALEVRSSAVSKGIVTTRVLENVLEDLTVAERQNVFLYGCGNDKSDEKLYMAMHSAQRKYNLRSSNVYTVSVGIQPSAARFFYKTQSKVLDALENMSGLLFRQQKAKSMGSLPSSSGLKQVRPDRLKQNYDMSFSKIRERDEESNDENSSSDNSERDMVRRGSEFNSGEGLYQKMRTSHNEPTLSSNRPDSTWRMKTSASAPSFQQVFPDGMRLRRPVKLARLVSRTGQAD